MSGWIAIRRGLHERPLFDKNPERFFVWTWILAAAAWQDTQQDADGVLITVKRGQLLTSYRQMSRATGVGVRVIRTLISRLQAGHSIDTDTGTGRLLITICNYEKYQKPEKRTDTPEGTEATQDRHTKETINHIPVGESDKSPPSEPAQITTVTSALWDIGKRYLSQHGVANPGRLIGKWLKTSGGSATEVMAAIEAAQKAGTHDPVPYIQKIINGGNKSQHSENGTHAGAFGFIPEVG